MMRRWPVLWMLALLCQATWPGSAATLSDSDIDAYNVQVGTQTFAPRYKFTTNTALVETAQAIQEMGSDVIKLYMGKNINGQYGIARPASITNLWSLAEHESSFRRVFDMPFRHYLVWIYCLTSSSDAWWKDGFSSSERTAEYNEVYAFARHLLTNYNHSGKSFYLGHWEGDWHLLDNYDTSGNPSATAIQGMIDWLNTRQQAVDDAVQNIPHTNVFVYHYTEANRVRDAMVNGPANNRRLANTVLPMVTNIDFVSWSAYDGQHLGTAELHATLDYLESRLPTNKAARISGKRVILGEFGWGGTLSSADQEAPTRAFMRRVVLWGARLVLFWQMYDNEGRSYWLIDNTHAKTPCYNLHQRFINRARLLAARFKETHARVPTQPEFSALTAPLLNQPLMASTNLLVTHLPLTTLTATSAVLNARVEQGVYGDDRATVRVFWGTQDAGTNATGWEHSLTLGVNTNFVPACFSASIPGLSLKTNYCFRFLATNATGAAWAPASGQFTTDVLESAQFGSRMKIAIAAYDRNEPLQHFPLLVSLSTNQPGFSYRQLASPTGGDLRFTDATGAQVIPHEIDEWQTNGTSHVWVRIPVLSGSNDFIWAHWGNPLATNHPVHSTNGAVWSNRFELVWHLKQTGFPYADSTLKHPANAGITPASTTAGRIGRGIVLNGASQFLNAGMINLGDQRTLSAWVRVDPTANSIQTLWANKPGGSATPGISLFVNSYQSQDGKLILESGNGSVAAYAATETNLVPRSQWKHVAAIIDRTAGTARLFVDGVDRGITDAVRPDFATNSAVALGRFVDGLYYFKGAIDEARIESVARSPNWLWATWMTVASNSTFLEYSDVIEQRAVLSASHDDGGLLINWPAPNVGYTVVSATNLTPSSVWTLVTNQPTLAAGRWELSLPWPNGTTRFYRLQKL